MGLTRRIDPRIPEKIRGRQKTASIRKETERRRHEPLRVSLVRGEDGANSLARRYDGEHAKMRQAIIFPVKPVPVREAVDNELAQEGRFIEVGTFNRHRAAVGLEEIELAIPVRGTRDLE